MDKLQSFYDQVVNISLDLLPKIGLAILVLVIGLWIIKRLTNWVTKLLSKSNFSQEITSFLISLTSISLKVLLLFSIAGIAGVDMTAFIAVLAAAGFAVGLALQGSLGNFAAGIIILVFRPYRIGDWIEIQEKFGKVEEIQIFNTHIQTPGRKVLIVPNGEIISSIVTNYSKKGFIRMELEATMPYNEDFPKIKEIIIGELLKIDLVLKDPAPEVGIDSFDSHNIILSIRPYVRPDHYWEVRFSVYAMIKAAFHQHQIKVAYSEGVEMGEIGQ